jgi:hypothetical protein
MLGDGGPVVQIEVVYCPNQVMTIPDITDHVQDKYSYIRDHFPIERLDFQGVDKARMPPVPNEDTTAEKERENQVVFVKQEGDEQKKCADKHSPVAAFFSVKNEKEYAAQENEKAEREVERECGRNRKAFVTDRHVKNQQ